MKNLYLASALTAVMCSGLFGLSAANAGVSAEAEVLKAADNAGKTVQVRRKASRVKESLRISLPKPEAAPAKRSSQASGIVPRQIGFARQLPDPYSKLLDISQLEWVDTGAGIRVARVSVASDTAIGMRLGVLVYRMPDNIRFRFFDATSDQAQVFEVSGAQINAMLEKDRASREPDSNEPLLYWTPVNPSAVLGVEIVLPPGVEATDVSIAVPSLSHFYAGIGGPPPANTFGVGDSQSCTIDYTCRKHLWEDVGPGVARMIFTINGSSYLCSGTLINDLDPSSQVPYFLTARHCISDQMVASSLQTYWFYRSRGCDLTLTSEDPLGIVNPEVKILSGGAFMLVDIPETDTTLLRLNETPPAGTVFAGWDTTPVEKGARVIGISHPAGDLKKISAGTTRGNGICYLPDNPDSAVIYCSEYDNGNYVLLSYDEGMVEGGSSGSGLFDYRTHKLVGTLTGGNASCGFPGLDIYYGRFDVAWGKGLSHWLGNTTSSCTQSPGDWAYCSDPACGACQEGQGDCDSDSECASGLVCAGNVGAAYGFSSTTDVCLKPGDVPTNPGAACSKSVGDHDYCSDPNCGPCSEGQGDCDSNAECTGSLVCLKDAGGSYGLYPTVDVCGPKPSGACTLPNGDWGLCSDPLCGPCAAGEGDCDGDHECNTGLVCLNNVGAAYGLPDSMDVCDVPVAGSCTKSVGDWQYCLDPACGPCTEGQGDCDTDAECAVGLSCRSNIGADYGLPANMDVCAP